MKKKLLTLLCLLGMYGLNAQITLDFTNNVPVPGDTLLVQTFDSSGVIPRNTGANQTWDFSTNLLPTNIKMYRYNAPSGYSNAPSGTTVVEEWDTMKVFYRSLSSGLEMLRLEQGDYIQIDCPTDGIVSRTWPYTYGNAISDTAIGTYYTTNPNAPSSGPVNPKFTSVVAGHGNLLLPAGKSYTNVILVIDSLSYNISFPGLLPGYVTTAGSIFTFYKFYHSTQKFPVFTVAFESTGVVAYNDIGNIIFSDGTDTHVMELNLNAEPVVSSNSKNIETSDFTLYPNPAQQNIMISGIEKGNYAIHNAQGKNISSGTFNAHQAIDISEYPAGLYFMNIYENNSLKGAKSFVIR